MFARFFSQFFFAWSLWLLFVVVVVCCCRDCGRCCGGALFVLLTRGCGDVWFGFVFFFGLDLFPLFVLFWWVARLQKTDGVYKNAEKHSTARFVRCLW